ncbi:Protein MAINTENANCE OF MERISTEMS [Bienertia sinuspersici]
MEKIFTSSCKYMLTALQSIMSTSGRSHVTFEEWCRFWFRAPKRYSATILPKAVENFSHFGIPESWSCIRPSVIKPASQLASGQRISLAIPVLASIYREAKVFICSGQDINWIGNCMRNPKDRLLIDDSTLRQDVEFLLSIRSCFLTLRYDNDHVVEPYSPHRFSRQFGFCQNIPGALKPDSEEPSLQYLWSCSRQVLKWERSLPS